jgi:hypothetical protein
VFFKVEFRRLVRCLGVTPTDKLGAWVSVGEELVEKSATVGSKLIRKPSQVGSNQLLWLCDLRSREVCPYLCFKELCDTSAAAVETVG